MFLLCSKDQKPSSSRTYVALCYQADFSGMYFRKFVLPDNAKENSVEHASWYFLNELNFIANIAGVITFEDFANCLDQDAINARDDEEFAGNHSRT